MSCCSVVADAQVEIAVRPNPVEPSRVSPADSEAFRRLQATILQVFPDALVAPGLMVGATDSRRYETLSENIFRFNPVRLTTADLARPPRRGREDRGRGLQGPDSFLYAADPQRLRVNPAKAFPRSRA